MSIIVILNKQQMDFRYLCVILRIPLANHSFKLILATSQNLSRRVNNPCAVKYSVWLLIDFLDALIILSLFISDEICIKHYCCV